MLPLAPGLLSTITGWPSCLPMSAASMRATVSRMPPGATGTTSVIGRLGNGCATAEAAAARNAKAAARSARFTLLRLDAGGPDDRPPLVDLALVERRESLRRLLLAGRDVEAEIGEARAHHGIRQ